MRPSRCWIRCSQAARMMILIGTATTFCALSAWAGYKSPKVKVDTAASYPCHQSQGTVAIAVDAYTSREKVKTAFDVKDLDKMGIIPVNIVISNEGEDWVSLSGEDVNLVDSRNHSIAPLPVDAVVRAILTRGRSPSQSGRTPAPFPMPRRGGVRGDAFELEMDFTNKALKELRIAPKATAFGFVFFQLPDNQMNLEGYKVYIPEVRNLKTKQNLLFFEIEFK